MTIKLRNNPKVFKDKNGRDIKPGDTIVRHFFYRRRERLGHRRIAFDMMGNEVIVSDEGSLSEPIKIWIKRRIKWDGACLIAERVECSDFQALMAAELFDDKGDYVCESSFFNYLNNCFKSKVYEVEGCQ